ncbi:hypothetical protein D3C86_1608270 [compost metagenome]
MALLHSAVLKQDKNHYICPREKSFNHINIVSLFILYDRINSIIEDAHLDFTLP